ncbi:hypothetical protein ABV409_14290 [Flagellimonas sp. DF-77]|uniref:hypothetical protein n=1 Tax=Flagellimonas algarum TaxID=3230298 RepID=UPI00339492EC
MEVLLEHLSSILFLNMLLSGIGIIILLSCVLVVSKKYRLKLKLVRMVGNFGMWLLMSTSLLQFIILLLIV